MTGKRALARPYWELLASTAIPIARISEPPAFHPPGCFGSIFHRAVGVTSASFRRRSKA